MLFLVLSFESWGPLLVSGRGDLERTKGYSFVVNSSVVELHGWGREVRLEIHGRGRDGDRIFERMQRARDSRD